MESIETEVRTGRRFLTDLSGELRAFCARHGDGLVNVFAPHATVGLALMELGAGSEADLAELLDRLLPPDDRYRHRHGSAGHGRDHVLPAIVAPSICLPVVEGEPALGTWQSLVLVDTNVDNVSRRIRMTFVGSPAERDS